MPVPVNQTERLCAILTTTTYENLPAALLEHATDMNVDSVGVTLLAAESDPVNVVRTTYSYDGDRNASGSALPARVPGTGERERVRDVAFLMGVMAPVVGFDDPLDRLGTSWSFLDPPVGFNPSPFAGASTG